MREAPRGCALRSAARASQQSVGGVTMTRHLHPVPDQLSFHRGSSRVPVPQFPHSHRADHGSASWSSLEQVNHTSQGQDGGSPQQALAAPDHDDARTVAWKASRPHLPPPKGTQTDQSRAQSLSPCQPTGSLLISSISSWPVWCLPC